MKQRFLIWYATLTMPARIWYQAYTTDLPFWRVTTSGISSPLITRDRAFVLVNLFGGTAWIDYEKATFYLTHISHK